MCDEAWRTHDAQGDQLSKVDAYQKSWTCHRAGQLARLTTFRTPRRSRISRSFASGREESAQQAMPIELLQPSLPALSTTTQPIDDPGQLCRNRSLSLAKEAIRVIDQLDISPEGNALRHAFTRRIQTRRSSTEQSHSASSSEPAARASNTASFRRFQ